MVEDDIKLEKVTSQDALFLYNLLKERNPDANISHKKMPTYSEHVKFLNSSPYDKWYVIKLKNKKVGSIYLTRQNEIGIFLKKKMQGKNMAKKSLQILMSTNPKKRYLANVSPKNKKSIRFFKNNGFKLIQYTYEFNSV